MKAGFKKNMISMLMALALVATAIPFTAMAAGAETLRTPEVLMDLNGFIGREDLNGYVGRAVEKYYGTSTPHDGIDAYDESFMSDFALDWSDSDWLSRFIYVSEGSTLSVTLRPDYTGEEISINPTVYALDDDGHIAYYAETCAVWEKATANSKLIFRFDNVGPMKTLYGSNGFLYDTDGTIPVEKLVYSLAIYKGQEQEERVGVYNFLIAKDTSSSVAATATTSKITLNGKAVELDTYNINSNNYCKIRDVAQLMNGTGKQFEVIWDKNLQAISMTSKQAYTPVGGELAKGNGSNQSATLNTAKIYLDGKEVTLTAYTIKGNNYFKLRDLGQLFNFGVNWDASTNTVTIDTSKGYTAS